MINIKKYDWWLEWGSTLVLLVGVALTSFNIYPLNLWVCLAANAGWIFVGMIWRKWSLIVVQLVVTAIYVAGLIQHYWF